MSFIKPIAALAACGLALTALPASAQTITNGFTYAVASGGGAPATGTHYHSNTGGAFGNPAGKAEVGRFSTETVRGLSEYNLASLTAAQSAFVTFDVFKKGGLFAGTNDTPFNGPITIFAYQGNNLEDISDYQATTFATIGTFNVSAATTNVGDIFSFDITSAFNTAISNGWSSLGIRLQADSLTASQAWTFQDFRLTSNNQSTNPNPAVPEPATWAMMIVGFGAVGYSLRAAKRRSDQKFDAKIKRITDGAIA